MYMAELSFLTWSSIYVVPRVKSGDPPQPRSSCATMKTKTVRAFDGSPSMQFSRCPGRWLPSDKCDDRPVGKEVKETHL
jgi:hypothetical protein